MAEPVRHRQTKGAATDMFDLQLPRHTSTLLEPESSAAAIRSVRFWRVCVIRLADLNRSFHPTPTLVGASRSPSSEDDFKIEHGRDRFCRIPTGVASFRRTSITSRVPSHNRCHRHFGPGQIDNYPGIVRGARRNFAAKNARC